MTGSWNRHDNDEYLDVEEQDSLDDDDDDESGDPEEDDEKHFDEDMVFVIMPFTDELEDAYFAIRDECSQLGLMVRRADDHPSSGIVIREIVDLIESAEFIICDLTLERPNVYYELGYAQGVGNEPMDIFLIAKQGTTLHFDVGAYRVRYYDSIKGLRTLIKNNFAQMVQTRRAELEE